MADIALHKYYWDYFKSCNNTKKSISLIISDELRNLLSKADSSNKFIQRLLNPVRIKASYIVPNNANFIDIAYDEEGSLMLSYYTPDALQRASRKTGISTEALSVSLSYLTNRNLITREVTKPGRLLAKIFDRTTNEEIEDFATVFKSLDSKQNIIDMFKEVSGDQISYYYNALSYTKAEDSEASTLHKSCMRYPNINMYMDLYAKNPDIISLLILPDKNNKIKGRAVIWTVGSQKYIDRIYFDSFSTYTMYVKYCRERKILNISERNSSFSVVSGLSKFSVQLKNWLFQYYPYPDTLTWLNVKTGVLSYERGDFNTIDMCKNITKFLPDQYKYNSVYAENTIKYIEHARARTNKNLGFVSDKDIVLFHIQATCGKGNTIVKSTTKGPKLVELDNVYRGFLTEESSLKTVTGTYSPYWHACQKDIVYKSNENTTAYNVQYVDSNTNKKYVEVISIDDYYYTPSYRYRGIATPFENGFQGNTMAKFEDTVKNKTFNINLLQWECVKTHDDDASYVPSVLYKSDSFKHLYDYIYTKNEYAKNSISVSTEYLPEINVIASLLSLSITDNEYKVAKITCEKIKKAIDSKSYFISSSNSSLNSRKFRDLVDSVTDHKERMYKYTQLTFLNQNYFKGISNMYSLSLRLEIENGCFREYIIHYTSDFIKYSINHKPNE